MINRTAIQQWSNHAPWIDNAQIEQDLIICRALVAIFSDEFLASQLAFRGGTALHKLYLSPQPRYIQVQSSPSCIVLVKCSIFFLIELRNRNGITIPCCSELSLKYRPLYRFD